MREEEGEAIRVSRRERSPDREAPVLGNGGVEDAQPVS